MKQNDRPEPSSVVKACQAADHLISSLLAVRAGATDDLLRQTQTALRDALAEAAIPESRPGEASWPAVIMAAELVKTLQVAIQHRFIVIRSDAAHGINVELNVEWAHHFIERNAKAELNKMRDS